MEKYTESSTEKIKNESIRKIPCRQCIRWNTETGKIFISVSSLTQQRRNLDY